MKKVGITVETRYCVVCKASFECEPAHFKQTCNEECKLLLIATKSKGKFKMSKIKKAVTERLKFEAEEASEHRATIFCGGELGEDKERDFAYSEEEILF